jgi:kynurenine 3-monooxygenase
MAMELERRFPDRFIPQYSMVMFHPEIPYAEAQRRGAVQARILTELDTAGVRDPALQEKLVKEQLEPIQR